MPSDYFNALMGGMLIGLAATILLLGLGRIAGISSILGRLLVWHPGDRRWRLAFILGLLAAGLSAWFLFPASMHYELRSKSLVEYIMAGLLVGFGTRLGSGCTSGHGVCGIPRFSTRSIVAVLIFMSVASFVATLRG